MSHIKHNFVGEEKRSWRMRNLEFLLRHQSDLLLENKLRGSYMELIGMSGSEFYALLTPYLQKPTDFIAVDRCCRVILDHREDMSAFKTIFSTSIIAVAQREIPIILNYDGYGSANSPSFWKKESFGIQDVIHKGIKKYGCFAFILNKVLGKADNETTHKTLLGFKQKILELGHGFRMLDAFEPSSDCMILDIYRGNGPRMITFRTLFVR
jgi:hypothetical protein